MDELNQQINNQYNKEQLFEKIKRNFSGPKIIFAILGVVLIVELVYAIRVLSSPTPRPVPVNKVTVAKTVGRISLFAPKRALKVGESVPVSVVVGTGGNTVDGADLIVRFDPKVIEASQEGLIKGKIFDEYPLVSLDSNKGLISISGISSSKKGFTGTGQFASIVLRAKSAGKTAISIDFNKGSTTDSNLVEAATSKDILEVVDNLEFNIN